MIKKFHQLQTLFLLFSVFVFNLVTFALPVVKAPGEFVFKRGTNISHWLSQSGARGDERRNYFTAKDVKYLADLGFDHIRIPVDEEQLWKENGQQDQEGFSLLQQALDWCKQYKLDAVVDLHILRSHHFNEKEKPLWTKPEAQERFFQCWRDLSAALKKYPVEDVAYELMNEPVADDPEDWNKLVEKAVVIIRQAEPTRKIVIGSNRWQSPDTFDKLRIPENDKNIILSFHMYEPFLLTHHTASWTGIRDYKGPVNYPGVIVKEEDLKGLPDSLQNEIRKNKNYYDIETIRQHFAKPIAIAKKYNLPLYCGEWGCLTTVPDAARFQWFRDVKSVLEENNIGWATWEYKSDFGIINKKGQEEKELIKILVGK
ncbi:MAG: glycosyl hydrolase family 5 [Segetibacter sp.]|nr:glycosyl hydrolase family 5 [Segetibacter sp.]